MERRPSHQSIPDKKSREIYLNPDSVIVSKKNTYFLELSGLIIEREFWIINEGKCNMKEARTIVPHSDNEISPRVDNVASYALF